LTTKVDDVEAGKMLGALLVPPNGEGRPLEMLTLGRLSALPLAVLRDGNRELVQARRPLARVLGLYTRTPATPRSDKVVVLSDSNGNLPMANFEGRFVQTQLGPGAVRFEGADVTGSVIHDAARADLLHIAGHAVLVGLDATFRLSKGNITATDLLEQQVGPRVAVISACGSAEVHDDGAWRTLASAMLKAGSQYVIATEHPVDDAKAFWFMLLLYSQADLRIDPVAAVARVQVALSRQELSAPFYIPPQQWAAFSVLVRPPMIPAANAQN